jgi:two-component system response regulator HydG
MTSKPRQARLLIADDDPITRRVIQHSFDSVGLHGRYFEDGDSLMSALDSGVEACVMDLEMPGTNGLECLKRIKEAYPLVEVIILTSLNRAAEAMEAVRVGAFDYITKPFDMKELSTRTRNAMAYHCSQSERAELKNSFAEPQLGPLKFGDSPVMRGVCRLVDRIAPTNNVVLLTGASGTGKTLLARSIHASSLRADQPFISVSCPSLPGELLESEMFGHEKGAFTGATATRAGRVQLAEGGTLFLDEIGELSLPLQSKLLTFLQDQTYFRIGGDKPLQGNVRIIAATNQDLEARVREGLFREDLYYRLNVLPIEMPPLKARAEDIPGLVALFAQRFAAANEQKIPKIEAELMTKLKQMAWPGNVRQLQNTIIRMLTLRRQPDVLSLDDWLEEDVPAEASAARTTLAGMTLAEIEKLALIETLALCGQRKLEAARMLGIADKSIYNKMKRHGLT